MAAAASRLLHAEAAVPDTPTLQSLGTLGKARSMAARAIAFELIMIVTVLGGMFATSMFMHGDCRPQLNIAWGVAQDTMPA